MNESDLLDALDRRAAAARIALDRAVDDLTVPPFERRAAERPWRRWTPALVAAVVVVALVGAALLTGRADESGTIAGEPETPITEGGGDASADGTGDLRLPGDGDGRDRPLAEVSVTEDGRQVSASLIEADGAYELRTSTTGPDAGTGLLVPVRSTSTGAVARDLISTTASDARGELIAGLIGPDVDVVDVVDAETGEVLDGASTATIQGSKHVLFLVILPLDHRDRDLVVVGRTTGGEEISLPAYASEP
jgi:hypothetical protein